MPLDKTTIVSDNVSTGGNTMTTTKVPTTTGHIAKCGHEDSLGYFTNTPCGKCVRKAHKKATRR